MFYFFLFMIPVTGAAAAYWWHVDGQFHYGAMTDAIALYILKHQANFSEARYAVVVDYLIHAFEEVCTSLNPKALEVYASNQGSLHVTGLITRLELLHGLAPIKGDEALRNRGHFILGSWCLLTRQLSEASRHANTITFRGDAKARELRTQIDRLRKSGG